MATNTTNNYFSKPAVGGDTDTWGATLNSNWDTVDSVLSGGTSVSKLGIGTTNSTLPLICNAASATDIAASFSGYVGIGTSNPSNPLHLKATTNIPALIETTHTDGNARLRFTTASGTDWNIGSNTNGNFTLFDAINNNNIFVAEAGAGASTLVIDSNSRVGIGTSSPAGNLHISAGTDGDATLILEADTDNLGAEADNPKLQLRQDGNLVRGEVYMEGDAGVTVNSSVANAFVLEAKDSNGNNHIQFATGGTTGETPTLGHVRMTIKSNGNVGIGDSNPSSPLTVAASTSGWTTHLYNNATSGSKSGLLLDAGSTVSDYAMYVRNATTNADFFTIRGDGNVGIGTSSPTEQLHITGNLKVDGVIRSATFDSGTSTTVNVLCDDAGNADLNLMGGNQGTGRLYVGQSSTHGGGIEYNGDSNPLTSGGGSDQIVLYRRSSGVNEWTARNAHSSNDWEFRGKVTADELAGTLASTIFNQIYPVGSIYISISPSFDPNNAFTGSWTQISGGEVLVAEGGTFTCGAGGGNSTHNHDVTVARDGWGSYQSSSNALRQPTIDGRLITGSGSNEIGENLESLAEATGNKTFTTDNTSTYPPYRVVAIWKRNS